MNKRNFLTVIGAWVVLLCLAGSATAYNPPQRGSADYPADAPAAFETITQKYPTYIAMENWRGLLNELEQEFFPPNPTDPAEVKALTGYRQTKNEFLESLGALPSPEPLREIAAGISGDEESDALVTSNTDVGSYVSAVNKASALPFGLTGLYQTDSINNVKSVFNGSVKSDQAQTGEFTEERLNTLFMLSDSIYSILQQAMAPFRQETIRAIRDARGRWEDYTQTVVAHQFPWEMFFNQLVGMKGSIEHPPLRNFFLLHPILAVEFTNPSQEDAWHPLDEATIEQAMQVNLFGISWLDPKSRYQRKFSVSGIVSYRSDIAKPGYGISLGFKRWVDVGLVHRSYEGRDDYSLVFAADFWGLIAKEPSGFVRDNAQWLEEAENLLR